MSVQVQITLPDEVATKLKRTAARLKVPLAQLIRETLEERLRSENINRKMRRRHPLASIIGLLHSEETDLASRVDEILYR